MKLPAEVKHLKLFLDPALHAEMEKARLKLSAETGRFIPQTEFGLMALRALIADVKGESNRK